ncbi:MAG: hypothetical protein ACJAV2_003043, partial [Myxococcota bacterium]
MAIVSASGLPLCSTVCRLLSVIPFGDALRKST